MEFSNFDKNVHEAVAEDVHQGRDHWRMIPHLLLYSIFRKYERYCEKRENVTGEERNLKFTIDQEDIDLANELLSSYLGLPQDLGPTVRGRQLPAYSQGMYETMTRFVDAFSAVNEIGGVYPLY